MRYLGHLLLIILALMPGLGAAQEKFADLLDGAEDKNGFIISFLEDQLSTDSRKIRLSGVSGLLSSSASVAQITVSDTQGVWLLIRNATVVWNRTALFDGAVQVERLSAELVEYRRNPVADTSALPSAQATSYRVPDLPVSVSLADLKIDRFRIGEAVFGTSAEMRLTGNLNVGGGVLDMALEMQRLDGPGGSFAMKAGFSNETEVLDLDLQLQEPPGGLVTSLASINGLPSLDLSIAGGGPLSDLNLGLSFRADAEEFLSGSLRVSGAQQDRSFDLDLTGQLTSLVSPSYRPFFEGVSSLKASGRRKPNGGLALDNLDLRTGAMYLTGWLVTTADGFLSDMLLTGAMGREDRQPIILPVPGGGTWLRQTDLEFRFNGNEGWGGSLNIQDLNINDFSFGDGALVIDGAASNIDVPGRRALSGRLTGKLARIDTGNADFDGAFGDAITLLSDFNWADGQPLTIEQMRVSGGGLALMLQGALAEYVFSGRFSARVDDLAPYSQLTGRDLAGGIRFESTGSLSPLSGAFDLQLDGATTDLQLGIRDLDRVLAGKTRLTGRLARSLEGTEFQRLLLANENMSLSMNGRILTDQISMDLRGVVNDLSVISDQHEGTLSLIVETYGQPDLTQISANVAMPGGRMDGHVIDNVTLSLNGQIEKARRFAGQLQGFGAVDGNRLFLTGALSADARLRLLRSFNFSLGQTQMRGTVGQGGDGLFAGTVAVQSADIAPVAALFLSDARGAMDITAELSRSLGQQRLRLKGSLRELTLDGISADSADVELEVVDLFGLPLFDGTAAGAGLQVAGQNIARFMMQAERTGKTMAVQATTRLANQTELRVVGDLTNLDPGIRLAMSQLDVARGDIGAKLVRPAEVEFVGGTLTLRDIELNVGEGGTLSAEGRLGLSNDLRFSARALPLNIASLYLDLPGIGGTVGGTGQIVGPAENPAVRFDLGMDGATLGVLTALGVPPLDATATGETSDGALMLTSTVSAANGLSADVTGRLPLSAATGTMDIAVALADFPLAVLNVVAGNPGLTGQVSGTANVTGPYADPEAGFDLRGTGLSARVLRENGLGALGVAIRGEYANGQIVVASASAQGPAGLAASGAGRIPLSGTGMDFSAGGTIPLSLANIALADSGIQVSGTARFSARATGATGNPDLSGSVQMNDGVMVDPRRNFRIEGLRLDADLTGTRMVLRSASGQFNGGGSITATGSLGLGPTTQTDLSIRLNDAHYTDGIGVDTTISGDISVTGPLARAGRVVARLSLGPTEIAVAENFGIREGVLLDVKHRNPPKDVRLTLDRTGINKTARTPSTEGNYFLDLVVDAPSRIFIRGRGLDVEMGGSLAMRGPVEDLAPVGRFEMRRGRMSVLGQRITFNDGWIALTGDFDPEIRLEAQTAVQATVVTLVVSGRVSDPDISLSSVPELPQDEILALLIFQRDLASLSPFQIAQLASAAATLAGRGGSLLDSFRARIGLDDFEIVSSEDGDLGVRAGAYLNENLYLDVEAASSGNTRATVNLDITDDVRAKLSLGTDGESSIGVFFERDY